MKKIFTFFTCIFFIGSSFAQKTVYKEIADSKIYTNANPGTELMKERNLKVDMINENNDYQVEQVIDNLDFDIWQKRDILNNLESDRVNKIKEVYLNYNNEVSYFNSGYRRMKTKHFSNQ